jgi:multiple sugar transport system permease protein
VTRASATRSAGKHAILLAGSLVMLLPFVWMVATSLEKGGFSNYAEAWKEVPFGTYFLNTIVVTVLTVLGVLVSSALAAYAFATMEFKGRGMLFLLFLSTMMVPQPVYLVPSYVILSRLHWIDIVPWTVNVFSIFLLRQHFRSIPRSLYEAAVLDGCSTFGYLWRVVLPLSRSALVTVILFDVIGSWNSFMWPLIVTNSENMRVLQVGLSYFNQEAASNFPLLMAASTFCTVPLLILFVLSQKQIVSSYARSGLKD